MRVCFLIALCLCMQAAKAQVDSFSRDGQMYYTYDAPNAQVRMFYPKSGLRLCPYCGRMETETHIKEVEQGITSFNGSILFIPIGNTNIKRKK